MVDWVSQIDIARRLNAPPGTVYSWYDRGHLPTPDIVLPGSKYGRPLWRWSRIKKTAVVKDFLATGSRRGRPPQKNSMKEKL